MTLLSVAPPPVNLREALRYAGCRGDGSDLPLGECVRMIEGAVSGRVLYEEVPVRGTEEGVDLGFAAAASQELKKNLAGGGRALVFAATAGIGVDRLIARYARISPVHALLLHGLGAERIEAICDAFCREKNLELAPHGLCLSPRFSPGYGDLPLSFQREIFSFLGCEKRLGLTLTPTLLMIPAKSVTAIAGIRPAGSRGPQEGCEACGKTDCAYRKDERPARCDR